MVSWKNGIRENGIMEKLYQEKIYQGKNSEKIASGKNCIREKLYQGKIVSGKNVLGEKKLYLEQKGCIRRKKRLY